MNIIDKLNEIANNNGWKFIHSYRDDHANLFDEILDSRQVVLLVESEIKGTAKLDDYGNVIGNTVAIDNCMLLRSSDISEPIGNETGYTRDSGRFNALVSPLISDELPKLQAGLSECECTLTNFQWKDVYNIFDYNLDGLIINFTYDCSTDD